MGSTTPTVFMQIRTVLYNFMFRNCYTSVLATFILQMKKPAFNDFIEEFIGIEAY